MHAAVEKQEFVWQPVTLRGVASFARASWSRLLVVQFVVALLAAAAVLWFLHHAWFTVIRQGINQMPAAGEIRNGLLHWGGESPRRLAENRFLALVIDMQHQGQARSPAHVAVEFGQKGYRIFSILGFTDRQYPRGWMIYFNRTELEPWWGAWSPAILAIVAAIVIVTLMATWAVLATLYAPIVWLLGFFANRDLNLSQSARLAGAALMPGALFICATIVCYGLGGLDLVGLAACGIAHVIIGWFYCAAATFRAPLHPEVADKKNPFVA
jgi:hypothetical protein